MLSEPWRRVARFLGMKSLTVLTEGLHLVAATPAGERAARASREELAQLLNCRSTTAWPPPPSEDVQGYWEQRLIEEEQTLGWTSWYWLLHDAGEGPAVPLLVGYGGFKGRPSSGVLEKPGFTFVGDGQEAGTIRYELQRT